MQEPSIRGTGIPSNMGLDHVGFVVPNAQRAADFFIEVFDAKFDWEVKRESKPTSGERGWDTLFGVHPDSYMPHVIMLKCGEQILTQYIELFEWSSPDQDPRFTDNRWHKFSDIANSYVSFTVKDLDAVMDHVKKRVIPKWPGVRFIQDPPMSFPLRGEVCRSTFLVSPWGMWIELTSWSESGKLGEVVAPQREHRPHPLIGQTLEALPAPAFMVDLDAIDHNIELIRARTRAKGVDWRIPCKAHKCPELAKYMLARGAKGVVVLTPTEAEKFADAGIDDIYLANVVGSRDDLKRLSLLAKRVPRLRVAVDSASYLKELAQAVESWEITTPIEVLVELNVNHNRCGVSPAEAVELAQLALNIQKTTGAVKYMGITGYEGHTPVLPPEDKTRETNASHSILRDAKTKLQAAGLEVPVVSGGGSSNYMDCLDTGVLTELQAGGGAICDLLYYHKAHLKNHGHRMGALILTQIVSVPEDKSRAIGNAGFKAVGWHPFGGLPEPRDRTDLRVIGLSAEHTKFEGVDPSRTGENGTPMKIPARVEWGDKIVLIPGYTDAMGFLHREVYGLRKDRVEHVWPTVSDTTW